MRVFEKKMELQILLYLAYETDFILKPLNTETHITKNYFIEKYEKVFDKEQTFGIAYTLAP